ncbi:MAG: hypothetical protein ACRYF4_11335 [Janthinobacterium lividum]
MKNSMLQAVLIAGLIGTAAAAPMAADAQVYVRVGPPRPLYERRPLAPAPGYAWRAGYHRWDGGRYVWVPGEYIAPPRPRAFWVAGRWDRGPRGYYWREGYWR